MSTVNAKKRGFSMEYKSTAPIPLGKWVSPPNQTWSLYFDPKHALFYHIWTLTNIARHMRSISSTRHQLRHQHTFSKESESTNNPISDITLLVPAELINSSHENINQNLQVLMGSKQSMNTTQSTWLKIDSYKKSISPERHRLLAWSSPRPPHMNVTFLTSSTCSIPIP